MVLKKKKKKIIQTLSFKKMNTLTEKANEFMKCFINDHYHFHTCFDEFIVKEYPKFKEYARKTDQKKNANAYLWSMFQKLFEQYTGHPTFPRRILYMFKGILVKHAGHIYISSILIKNKTGFFLI
jgi:hypothetical protein